MDQQSAAVLDPCAPGHDVGPCRCVAVRAIDVQHADFTGDLGVRIIGEHPEVPYAVCDAGISEVLVEDRVIAIGCVCVTVESVVARDRYRREDRSRSPWTDGSAADGQDDGGASLETSRSRRSDCRRGNANSAAVERRSLAEGSSTLGRWPPAPSPHQVAG